MTIQLTTLLLTNSPGRARAVFYLALVRSSTSRRGSRSRRETSDVALSPQPLEALFELDELGFQISDLGVTVARGCGGS